MKNLWGFMSLALGLISITGFAAGLLSNFQSPAWVVAGIALAGLLSGLNALAKQADRFAAWGGVVCSSFALVATSIAYGIGHGLR